MRYFYPEVGNDPELFITEKGKLVPSEKVVPRRPPNGLHKVKVDNAAVELNFPANTCLQYNLGEAARALFLLKNNYMDGKKNYQITLKPAMEVEAEDMETCGSLLAFGCDPSLLYYKDELKVSRPTCDPRTMRFRSIGFHVHLGWEKPGHGNSKELNDMATILHTTEGRVRLVQMCDYIVGLPAVLLERDDKAVQIRRNMLGYGRAGEFREQPHGFEYRTLGPWPLLNPAWAWWANGAVRDALQLVMMGMDKEIIKKISGQDVSDTINTNNRIVAARLWVDVKKAIADLIRNERVENGKHPILGYKNLRLFEFAVVQGGLNGNSEFNFAPWVRGMYDANRTLLKRGFPARMGAWAHHPLNWKKYLEFCNIWDLTKDNLSKHI